MTLFLGKDTKRLDTHAEKDMIPSYFLTHRKMQTFNRYTRIAKNRRNKLEHYTALTIMLLCTFSLLHVEYEAQQLERSLIAYAE